MLFILFKRTFYISVNNTFYKNIDFNITILIIKNISKNIFI